MVSEYDNLIDPEMYSSPNSSRASMPSIADNTHENCQKRKHPEKELKTYTASISHNEILLKNLERQGLQNHAIYVNQWTMMQDLIQHERLIGEYNFIAP
ncbi:hypothetical protein NPIL_471311 [Nephila pilipes]|uniref:Uncharacterized protein n=1 Tax=Nephila pilipes TaxID=299642 RepID=A0A8X6IEL3_NEPPI|nr:hypothetical protein NPIL_471311 [Nephila pilipes]